MIAHHSVLRAALPCLLVGFAACGSSGPSGDAGGSDTASITSGVGGGTVSTVDSGVTTTGAPSGCLATALADGSLDLQINAVNNYAFESSVTLNVIKVAPKTPLIFDWSGLTTDITQQPITSGEVQAVLVALLILTPDAFEMKINANERLNDYSTGALAFYPTTQTAANLYEFSGPGSTMTAPATEIDPFLDPSIYAPEAHTYAALVQDRTDAAKGVRMVQAFQLDPNSINTDIAITNDSSLLQYHTDLTTVVPLQVPAGTAKITADWRAMETGGLNGLGNPWTVRQVDEVMIGHYSLSPAELTAQFLAIETIADELYRGPSAPGAKVDLTTLTEETTGVPFAGIDGTGTWILALNCKECANPAPWFLTILQPCP